MHSVSLKIRCHKFDFKLVSDSPVLATYKVLPQTTVIRAVVPPVISGLLLYMVQYSRSMLRIALLCTIHREQGMITRERLRPNLPELVTSGMSTWVIITQ